METWLYVAEDSLNSADCLVGQIEAEAQKLILQPKMGRTRNELADLNAIHFVLLRGCSRNRRYPRASSRERYSCDRNLADTRIDIL